MKRLYYLFFAGILFMGCQDQLNIQNSQINKPVTKAEEFTVQIDEPYIFLAEKDFKAWVDIISLEDRLAACRIPDNTLKAMTTDALVRTVLKYPLNFIYSAYNDPLSAVDIIVKNSPLHQELIQRRDAAETILQYFENTIINMDVANSSLDKSYRYINYADEMFLEYLIASGIIKGFDDSDIAKKLITIVDNKVKERMMDTTYSEYSIRPLIAIKNKIINVPAPKSSTYIYTYFGQALGVYSFPELSAQEIIDITNYYVSNYPNAEMIRPASAKYNCHSYAWYSQSTSNQYWLNSHTENNAFQLRRYWTDDYYYATTAVDAEIVYYSSGDHSAIPLSTSYISKWGQAPLMKHSPTYCPYISTNRQYYKHRTSLPYTISSSIVGDNVIPANTPYNYNLPQYYAGMTITWSAEPFPGISGTCQVSMNSDQSCSFSASASGAYYLYVEGYRNGIQMIDGYMIIAVYEE